MSCDNIWDISGIQHLLTEIKAKNIKLKENSIIINMCHIKMLNIIFLITGILMIKKKLTRPVCVLSWDLNG